MAIIVVGRPTVWAASLFGCESEDIPCSTYPPPGFDATPRPIVEYDSRPSPPRARWKTETIALKLSTCHHERCYALCFIRRGLHDLGQQLHAHEESGADVQSCDRGSRTSHWRSAGS